MIISFFLSSSLNLSLSLLNSKITKGGGRILLILFLLRNGTGVANYFRFDWLRLIVGDTVLSAPIPFLMAGGRLSRRFLYHGQLSFRVYIFPDL